MNFRDEVLNHFMDDEGLVAIDRDPTKWSSGNGLLFSGLFYTILHKLREATPEDVARFHVAVDRCWEGPYGDRHIVGLLERNEGREDKQAHDDYVGVMAASFHLNTYHGLAIYNYGRQNWWIYDNVNPGNTSFKEKFTSSHLRFPGLVGFYHAAVRKPPGFIHNHLLAGKILSNAYSDKHDIDGKLMTWLMISVLEETDYCALVGDAMDAWKSQFRKNYGTLGKMLAPYFNKPSNNFNHPFSKIELTV